MPEIGDLKRLGSPFSNGCCIFGGTVSAHDFHCRMVLKPGRNGLDFPIRQHINGRIVFQIADQRSITQSTLPRPIINSNHSWRGSNRQIGSLDETQKGVRAARDAQLPSQACSCFTAQCKAHLPKGLLQSQREFHPRQGQRRKAFGKDFADAGALLTEEAAHTNHQMNRTSTGWQIAYGARVTALYPFADGPTTRAWGCWRSCTHRDGHLISHTHLLNNKVGKVWNDGHWLTLNLEHVLSEDLFGSSVYHISHQRACGRTIPVLLLALPDTGWGRETRS